MSGQRPPCHMPRPPPPVPWPSSGVSLSLGLCLNAPRATGSSEPWALTQLVSLCLGAPWGRFWPTSLSPQRASAEQAAVLLAGVTKDWPVHGFVLLYLPRTSPSSPTETPKTPPHPQQPWSPPARSKLCLVCPWILGVGDSLAPPSESWRDGLMGSGNEQTWVQVPAWLIG